MALNETEKLRLALELLRDVRRRLAPRHNHAERPPEQSRRIIARDIRQFLIEIEK